MKLTSITFTGIDEHTDLEHVEQISQCYPYVEWGVLTSYHWHENGNRYLDPEFMSLLRGRGLNLSLHICGSAVHDAAVKEWDKIDELTKSNLDIFKRVQLNISGRKDSPAFCWIPIIIGQELIVQQKGSDNIALFNATVKHWRKRPYPHRDVISVLLDASGGRGIDTPIEILDTKEKVGYAGGINPDNVADKLTYLFENVHNGEFWIDMESGVRDADDWLDLNKVEQVLKVCDPIIKEHESKMQR